VYRREGQTLDQVLFSEPSTKMKEKMMSLKVEQDAKEEQKEVDLDTLSAEDRLLEERFGKKNKE